MKTEEEIRSVLKMSYKEIEQVLGIKIRNGQIAEGIRKALTWVKVKRMIKNEIKIDGIKYIREGTTKTPAKKNKKGLEYCIVRTYSAGVFAGYFDRKNKGKEGTVYDARRLWSWSGAASLSQMANDGVKNTSGSKFAQIVLEVDLREIIEVIPCTSGAKDNIERVPVWQK